MQCSELTKKGKPCPLYADRNVEGVWYCHVHDPKGTFRRQVEADRFIRAAEKAAKAEDKRKETPAPGSVWRKMTIPERLRQIADEIERGGQ